jgi:hypothetical protein
VEAHIESETSFQPAAGQPISYAIHWCEPGFCAETERPSQPLARPCQSPPKEACWKHQEHGENHGHQQVAGGRDKRRNDAEQAVRYRHSPDVDREEYRSKGRHPHEIGGTHGL